jgi:nucleotide-binding universal stress UspA family protein
MNTHPKPSVSPPLIDPGQRDAGAELLRRVLVPTDLSPHSLKAIDVACALADAAHAAIQFVHVVEPAPFLSSLNDLPIVLSDEELMGRWKRLIERLAEERGTPHTTVSSEVRIGKPAHEIVAIAEETRPDLLVISTHGRTGLKHVLLGSTAERIVRLAPCPVMVVRDREAGAKKEGAKAPQLFTKILVPNDFSTRAQAALSYAGRFASKFGGELVVLHCIHYEPNVVGPEYGAFDLAVLNEVSRKTAITELTTMVRDCVPAEVQTQLEVRVGPPIGEVPQCAREIGADLIICATHGRTGLPHVLFGSTAEGIVRHSPCPVLVLPQRFLEGRNGERHEGGAAS